jgi:hypothetical protein
MNDVVLALRDHSFEARQRGQQIWHHLMHVADVRAFSNRCMPVDIDTIRRFELRKASKAHGGYVYFVPELGQLPREAVDNLGATSPERRVLKA